MRTPRRKNTSGHGAQQTGERILLHPRRLCIRLCCYSRRILLRVSFRIWGHGCCLGVMSLTRPRRSVLFGFRACS